MIVVISCAGSKKREAGYYRTRSGRKVKFVAKPSHAPRDLRWRYARPDDLSDWGVSWRKHLVDYNAHPRGNPFGLFPAGRLYTNKTYRQLEERYGLSGYYILSAGWGLVRADFLTPKYDITLGLPPWDYRHRRQRDCWDDRNMLPAGGEEPVMFFGGKDYVPLFWGLTKDYRGDRIVWSHSGDRPVAPGCCVRPFCATKRKNWHYECVSAFLDGKLD